MLRVPVPVTGDASDVALALEVAGALWEKGDKEESLRWLKRAVEAAGEAGDAPRAANLAKVVGDLEALEAASEVQSGPVAVARAARMRVSVKTSVRDPNLLLLRPLPEGSQAPAGTREAFLVFADDARETAAKTNRSGSK